ncbi:MAG: SprT family zinc-dependent metalloprotease [Sphingomicrobium sp.]
MWSNARFSSLAVHDGLPVPVDIRPMRNARRLRLRYDEKRGVLKLTCPVRTSRRSALAWAAEQRAWVEAQIAAAAEGEPFVPGALIPLDGREVRLIWDEGTPRTPVLDSDELRCGGPRDGFARRIERFLKTQALETLSRETAEYAAKGNLTVRAVSVGDADTRWGSCTADGRIRYSWRLILAEPDARRYVVAHEVAHLAHLDHGPRFKALEAELFGPGVSAAKASLRRSGHRLKRLGRGL